MKAIRLITAVLSAAAVLIGIPASGYAATLILLQDPNFVYNQHDGRPCVIGDPSCESTGWDTYVIQPGDVTGTPPGYAVSSPIYTVGQIRDLGKGEFINIGIDVNSAAPPVEALLLFDVLINGVSAFSYTGTMSLQELNPGTGKSDALLQGLNLTGYLNTDTIRFFAHVLYASDGREQFFLVGGSEIPDQCVLTPEHPDCTPPPPPTCEQTNTCPPPPPDPSVPEPASLLLIGSALAAGVLRRQHRQAKRK